jgi:hypothetical protein
VYVKREEGKREPISQLGVVVDLARHTVSFDGRVTHIDHNDDAGVIFLVAIAYKVQQATLIE